MRDEPNNKHFIYCIFFIKKLFKEPDSGTAGHTYEGSWVCVPEISSIHRVGVCMLMIQADCVLWHENLLGRCFSLPLPIMEEINKLFKHAFNK